MSLSFSKTNNLFPVCILYASFWLGLALTANAQSDTLDWFSEKEYLAFQTKKGHFFTNASFGIGAGLRSENSNSFSSLVGSEILIDANASPKLGYFVANKFVVGASAELLGSVVTYSVNDSYNIFISTGGVFGRYYSKGGVFGEFFAGVGNGRESDQVDGMIEENRFRSARVSGAVGVGLFWFKHVNFEFSFRFGRVWNTFDDPNKNFALNNLNVNSGIGITF
jgi:hypothetical protein